MQTRPNGAGHSIGSSGWASPLLAAMLLALAGRAVAAQPNVVLILADDLGFSDTAPYGSEISTPHISRLADEGDAVFQLPHCGKLRADACDVADGGR